jgi:ankyrin repeat protein
MPTVDDLIDLIDGRDEQGALAMLRETPELAAGESEREGTLAGATPLHWAAHRNSVELCRRLCQLGADVNSSGARWWRTPLAWGADAGSAEAIEFLLAHGADVNQDAYGNMSALHAVAQGGSTAGTRDPKAYRRAAAILIAHGVGLNRVASGDGGQSALGDAIRKGNRVVAELLRSHGAEEIPYKKKPPV